MLEMRKTVKRDNKMGKKDSDLLSWTAQDEEDLYNEQKEYRQRNRIPMEQ